MNHHHAILTGSALLLLTVATFAGPAATPPPKLEPKSDQHGLVFADGLLTLDITERLRFEVRSNNRDFNNLVNEDNDDAWVINRFRFGIGLKPASWLKIYGQLQDTREWNSERPNTPGIRGDEGDDNFDLRQGYVEFGNLKEFPLSLTVGRQVLNYGDSRLVADPQWTNFGRTFDAVKLRYEQKGFGSIDLFAARPVQIKQDVFNDSDSADNFFGAYASLDMLSFQTTDVYVLYRDKADVQPDLDPTNKIDPRGTFNGPAQRITTIGTRWASKKGALGPWDYGFEGAYQFGDLWAANRVGKALDQKAFALHAHGGYTFDQAAWKPRVGLEYNYSTGDKNPADGKSESFQTLFPSNFAPYGYMDEIAWRNMHNARLHLTAQPTKQLTVELSYHALWLADTNDYWYRNGVSSVRTKTPTGADVRTVNASNFLGHEIDLAFTYKPNDWLTVFTGYSHFFAEDYLKDTGPSDDADFAYIQAGVQF